MSAARFAGRLSMCQSLMERRVDQRRTRTTHGRLGRPAPVVRRVRRRLTLERL